MKIYPYICLSPSPKQWCPDLYQELGIGKVFWVLYFLWFTTNRPDHPSGVLLALIRLGAIGALHFLACKFFRENLEPPLAEIRIRLMKRKCAPGEFLSGFDSEAERQLYLAFAALRLPVRSQEVVRNRFGHGSEYRTDFSFHDVSCGLRVDIEVDGKFKQQDDDIQRRMAERDNWFVSKGWHVLRFHAGDCYRNPMSCAAAAAEYIRAAAEAHRQYIRSWAGAVIVGGNW